MKEVVSAEVIATKILVIRGKKVMLDRDLARLYGVKTSRLNEQVKRNIRRFPEDFMFQLTEKETESLMSQIAISRWGGIRKLPYVFTQEGVAMLSGVLNSERAIKANIAIMRAFIKLSQILSIHREFAIKLSLLEKRYSEHDEKIKEIFETLRRLMPIPEESKRIIKGFGVNKRRLP